MLRKKWHSGDNTTVVRFVQRYDLKKDKKIGEDRNRQQERGWYKYRIIELLRPGGCYCTTTREHNRLRKNAKKESTVNKKNQRERSLNKITTVIGEAAALLD